MSDHLSDELFSRLFRLDASDDPGVWEEAFLHLRTCSFCGRRARPWLKLLFRTEEVIATTGPSSSAHIGYIESVERAFSALQEHQAGIKEQCAELNSALVADPPIDILSEEWDLLSHWCTIMLGLHESHALRYSNPQEMLNKAFLAHVGATNFDDQTFGAAVAADLRARTAMELANALRINERFQDAAQLLAEADRHLAAGTGDLMLRARLCDVGASYATDKRLFGDALSMIDRAREIYEALGERHLAGRALVSKAMIVGYDGDPELGRTTLLQALQLLDRSKELQLYSSAQLNLLHWSVECGEYREAGSLLVSSGLREAFADEPLNLLKLRWVEAKVHAGLGRLQRAEQALEEVCRGFNELGRHYHGVVASLDLAEIWLREGRLQEVTKLAQGMHTVFMDLRFGREAQRAARYFAEACKAGIVTANVIRYVADFLNRFERDRGIVFWVPRTLP